MKKNFKINAIEVIALQFIKYAENASPPKKLNSNYK